MQGNNDQPFEQTVDKFVNGAQYHANEHLTTNAAQCSAAINNTADATIAFLHDAMTTMASKSIATASSIPTATATATAMEQQQRRR